MLPVTILLRVSTLVLRPAVWILINLRIYTGFYKLANLYRLFRDLKFENVEQHVAETYAKEFYFNDTLHTFTDRDDLACYLSDGAERGDSMMVEFVDIAVSGDNYYVRWVMDMKFKVMWKSIGSHSIGIRTSDVN